MSRAKSIIKKHIVEKAYTDDDAIKDYQASINKQKKRIPLLKQDIKKDQDMIKDKTDKMNAATDAELKKRYAANIERLKASIKETEAIIKEVQAEVKEKEAKLADAKKDLADVRSKKGEAYDAKEVTSTLVALNSTGGAGSDKYPFGNKELTAKVKSMEQAGLISYDDKYGKWSKGKK